MQQGVKPLVAWTAARPSAFQIPQALQQVIDVGFRVQVAEGDAQGPCLEGPDRLVRGRGAVEAGARRNPVTPVQEFGGLRRLIIIKGQAHHSDARLDLRGSVRRDSPQTAQAFPQSVEQPDLVLAYAVDARGRYERHARPEPDDAWSVQGAALEEVRILGGLLEFARPATGPAVAQGFEVEPRPDVEAAS